MIINQVYIRNYGRWHEATIPLSPRLAVLYGHNEAGKTTLLSFIRGVLFGFLARNPKHYIPRQAKNYGGHLDITDHHHRYVIARQSGKNGGSLKIMDTKGNSLPLEVLKKILGPIDRTTFDALYYFGNVDLKGVSRLKKMDLIQRIQRIGLAHSDEWIMFRRHLLKRSRQLYSPTGYRPVLNQKLKGYQRLEERLERAKEQYRSYVDWSQKRRLLWSHRKRLEKTLHQMRQHSRRLHQVRNDGVQYQRLADLKSKVSQPLRDGMDTIDYQRWLKLDERSRTLDNQSAELKERLQHEQERPANDGQFRLYLQHRSLISDLKSRFNAIREQMTTAALRRQTLRSVQRTVQQLKPHCIVRGTVQMPLRKPDVNVLVQLRSRMEHVRKTIEKIKAARLDVEARINAAKKQHVLFQAHKLVPGIGLLTLNVSLIKSRTLKQSEDYRTIRALYHRPQQLRNRLYYYQKSLVTIRQRVENLGHRYHYRLDQSEPINHWLAMQDRLSHFQAVLKRQQTLQSQLKKWRSRFSSYLDRWTFLKTDSTVDLKERFRLIEDFVDRMKRRFTNHQEKQIHRQQLSKRYQKIRGQAKDAMLQLRHFYKLRGVKTASQFQMQVHRQQHLKSQKAEYQKLSRQFGAQKLARLNRHFGNVRNLTVQVRKSDQRVAELTQQSQSLIQKETKLTAQLRQLIRDGSYDELQQRLANARTEINELVKRWLILRLTSDWVNQTLNIANRGRIPKVERQAREYFRILTDGHYLSVIFNQTGIKVLSSHRQRFDLHRLSKGTLQQLYLALVFALANVFGRDYPLPLLIDDGFTDFDINRRRKTWQLLKRFSQRLQIIYCTSDNQIAKYYHVDDLSRY